MGATREVASRIGGISIRTLSRWMREPNFHEVVERLQRAMFVEAVGLLRTCALDAVRALHDVITDPGSPVTARVGAARAVLDLALRAHEIEEVEARLTELEERVADQQRCGAPWLEPAGRGV